MEEELEIIISLMTGNNYFPNNGSITGNNYFPQNGRIPRE
jgi:hypothetical protein